MANRGPSVKCVLLGEGRPGCWGLSLLGRRCAALVWPGRSRAKLVRARACPPPGRVGKTSLLVRYVQERFSEASQATVQASFMSKKVTVAGQEVRTPYLRSPSVWEITQGQQSFTHHGHCESENRSYAAGGTSHLGHRLVYNSLRACTNSNVLSALPHYWCMMDSVVQYLFKLRYSALQYTFYPCP